MAIMQHAQKLAFVTPTYAMEAQIDALGESGIACDSRAD